jgi:hypothetical protein
MLPVVLQQDQRFGFNHKLRDRVSSPPGMLNTIVCSTIVFNRAASCGDNAWWGQDA